MMRALGSGPQKFVLAVKDPWRGISTAFLVFSNLGSLTLRALVQCRKQHKLE